MTMIKISNVWGAMAVFTPTCNHKILEKGNYNKISHIISICVSLSLYIYKQLCSDRNKRRAKITLDRN